MIIFLKKFKMLAYRTILRMIEILNRSIQPCLFPQIYFESVNADAICWKALSFRLQMALVNCYEVYKYN